MKVLNTLLLAAAFSILALNAAHGAEIINGKKAKKSTLTFMASVQSNRTHICGGFLINPSYVLTAAHCEKSDLSVVLGTQNIEPGKKNLRRYAVEHKFRHPSYKNVQSGFDIMLLKLSEKVKLTKGVTIIKISGKSKPVEPNIKCQVAGWGLTETKIKTDDLMVADVSTINITVCMNEWKNKEINLPVNILCAGGYRTKSGACQGDSGGPLVCRGLAVGIVSFNHKRNCTYPNVPNVYTEISAYINWIKNVIKRDA